MNAYETFLLYKVLKGRFVSGPVYSAISNLKKTDGARQAIAALAPQVLKDELKDTIRSGNLDNDEGKLLICKWVWIQEASIPDDLVQQHLDFGKATLEHIVPQTIENGTNWATDFSKAFAATYTYRLGNMTLLTGRSNSAARNFDFSKKKTIYAKTKLAITQTLAVLASIDAAFIQKRHEEIVATILDDLNL